MKRFFALLTTCIFALAAYAQTAEEIIAQMDAAMEQVSAENGFRMTMDIKIPILGTMSSDAWSLGDKMRLEANMMGKKLVTWQDGQTEWTYDANENTITIENRDQSKKSDEKENMKMFQSATEGYDVSISKETDKAWYLRCKKSRTNTNKDDPKNMDLVVAKDSYLPISLSTKMYGITITMRDLGFDVTDQDVTFREADYPGVQIVDER